MQCGSGVLSRRGGCDAPEQFLGEVHRAGCAVLASMEQDDRSAFRAAEGAHCTPLCDGNGGITHYTTNKDGYPVENDATCRSSCYSCSVTQVLDAMEADPGDLRVQYNGCRALDALGRDSPASQVTIAVAGGIAIATTAMQLPDPVDCDVNGWDPAGTHQGPPDRCLHLDIYCQRALDNMAACSHSSDCGSWQDGTTRGTHGVCDADRNTCVCAGGWSGSRCETPPLPPPPPPPPPPPDNTPVLAAAGIACLVVAIACVVCKFTGGSKAQAEGEGIYEAPAQAATQNPVSLHSVVVHPVATPQQSVPEQHPAAATAYDPPVVSGAKVPATLAEFLEGVRLTSYEKPLFDLGVSSVEDLSDLTEPDRARASLRVPHARGIVPARREHAPPFRAVRRRVHLAGVPRKRVEARARRGVPHARRTVVARRDHTPSVRDVHRRHHPPGVPRERVEARAGRGIPQPRATVPARREHAPPVWAVRRRHHHSGVPRERVHARARRGVPHARGTIFARREHAPPVRAVRH